MNQGHVSSLKKTMDAWAKLGHTDLKYLNNREIPAFVDSRQYIGGLFDPKGAHLHPTNYALGVMQTAQAAGCKIYDETPVLSVTQGSTTRIQTAHGAVNAKFVVLGGYVKIPGLPRLNKKILPAAMPMLA